jgi:hypothetical protein
MGYFRDISKEYSTGSAGFYVRENLLMGLADFTIAAGTGEMPNADFPAVIHINAPENQIK